MANETVVYTPENNGGSVPAWLAMNNGGFGNGLGGWGGGILGFFLGLLFGNGWGGFGNGFGGFGGGNGADLAVAIASELGIDLESETPAYLAGDSARALAEVVCVLGCDHCRG